MRLFSPTMFSRLPALALAAVSAGFAIDGLTAMFPGAFVAVIAMGIAIEIGKLFAFHILHRYGAQMGLLHRTLIGAVAVLVMALNALGCFGFLSRAHIEHAAHQSVAAEINHHERIVADLDQRLAPQTRIVETSRRGRMTRTSVPIEIEDRAAVEAQRSDELSTLADLRKREALNQAEVGPARYLAELIGGKGADLDKTMQWVTLAFVLVLDPFAVMLLLAANYAAPRDQPRSQRTKRVKVLRRPVAPRKTGMIRKRRKALGRGLSDLRYSNDNVVSLPVR